MQTIIFAIMVAATLTFATAQAQNVQRIAAIVNDDAISVYDLLVSLSTIPSTKV